MDNTKASTAQPSAPQRKHRWARVFAGFGLVLMAAWGVIVLILPPLVAGRLETLAYRSGLPDLTLTLDRITPWQTRGGDLLIGTPPEFKLDRLQIVYWPLGLLHRTIERVRLSGLHLKLQRQPEGWIVAGLPASWFAASDDGPTPRAVFSIPAWRLAHLEIQNGQLEVRDHDLQLRLPFNLELHSTADGPHRYEGRLSVLPAGQEVRVKALADLEHSRLALKIEATLDLHRLAAAGLPVGAGAIDGRLNIDLQAGLEWNPQVHFTTVEGALRLGDTLSYLSDDGRRWRLTATASREDGQLTFGMAAPDAWQWRMNGLELVEPLPLRLSDGQGRLTSSENGLAGSGRLMLESQPATPVVLPGLPPLTVQGRIPLEAQWRLQNYAQWELTLSGEGNRWRVSRDTSPEGSPSAEHIDFTPHLHMRAETEAKSIAFDLQAALEDIEARLASTRIKLGALASHSKGRLTEHSGQGQTSLKLTEGRFANAQVSARLPQVVLEGDWHRKPHLPDFTGRLSVQKAAAQLPTLDLQIDGIQLNLPLTWPPGQAAPGFLKVARANLEGRDLGDIEGSMRLKSTGLTFDVAHVSRLIPGARLALQGTLTIDPAAPQPAMEAAYRLERPLTEQDLDLVNLLPAAGGLRVNGQVLAQGQARYRNGRFMADLHGTLHQGRVLLPEGRGGISGLEAALDMQDLAALRSQPRQRLQFDKAFLSNITITEGKFDFQVEPGGTLFLEQGRFRWCEGSVWLPATRIVPGVDDYAFSLTCDRLKLAPLLEQLGAAKAEGDGSVSGRLPLEIRQGQIFIDNGFLYSSPGEGGTIRLRGTDLLTAGVPVDTPQYIQLDLARQALKDYDYTWVKLGLATEPQGDVLRLKLQLDGKPSQPLPFKYDSEAGGFVPVGANERGSTFQGISLDVNFSLPLNRLLQYKNLLKLMD
jgi:hypothetical protein